MTVSAALHAAVETLRRRPADLLPLYMLGAAVPAIARVATFVGLAVAYAYLEVTGRLDRVRSAVAGRELNPPDPQARPDAFAEWAERLAQLLAPLFPPVVVVVLAVAVVLTLVAVIVLVAATSAGQIAACDARLHGERGLSAGVAGVRRHWRAFLVAFVVEAVVWIAVSLLVLLVVAVGLAISALVGFLLALVALLVWLVVVLATRAVFAFVPAAIVVDGVGVRESIRGSAGFVRRNPVEAAAYYAIAVGALVGLSTLVGVLTVIEAGAVAAPLAVLVVTPALDLVKTGLYGSYRGSLSPPAEPVGDLRGQLAAGTRRGLGELVGFVRETPGIHALALAVGVAGAAMGWVAVEPLVGSIETSIVERLSGHVPPVATLNFFANNWTVAFSTAYSGVALGVPAALSLWFNGLLLGAVARLEVDPVRLAAFVAPHGVLELPALIVAGALGGYLGVVTWRTWRGRAGREMLADALERAFWVLVGLGVVLFLAALIEGFVSPYYWRPFL